MMLRIKYEVREFILDIKMIGYNLILPLILSVAAAVVIILGIKNNTAELNDTYVVLQSVIGLSASWISVYCQQNVIERNGGSLMFSLPIGKMYIGPYRSFRSGFIYTVLFAVLSYIILSRLTYTGKSLVLCGIMVFQALFFAGFGLLSVNIVRNCYIALFFTVTYIILFFTTGDTLPDTLNIFLTERKIADAGYASMIHPAFMAASVWSVASILYCYIK